QMNLWPGDAYFGYRYDYAGEYVRVMKELWAKGASNFSGKYFTLQDCHMKPVPAHKIELVVAGQSQSGIDFAAQHTDYNFVMGSGINTPLAHSAIPARLKVAADKVGRDVGSYVLFMVIADETDELAQKKWDCYRNGVDAQALLQMRGE